MTLDIGHSRSSPPKGIPTGLSKFIRLLTDRRASGCIDYLSFEIRASLFVIGQSSWVVLVPSRARWSGNCLRWVGVFELGASLFDIGQKITRHFSLTLTLSSFFFLYWTVFMGSLSPLSPRRSRRTPTEDPHGRRGFAETWLLLLKIVLRRDSSSSSGHALEDNFES